MTDEKVRIFDNIAMATEYRAKLMGRGMEIRYLQSHGIYFLWKPPAHDLANFHSTVLCLDGKWRAVANAVWPDGVEMD